MARSTSYQGSQVSYYSSPSQGRVVQHGSGWAGAQQGGTYRVRTPAGSTLQGKVPDKTYHRIVLAEFIGTILIIGAQAVLTPAGAAADIAGGSDQAAVAAVSYAGPLVRMSAACMVFLILALMASGPRAGKVASAFGALIVLGAMLNATDMWTAIGKAIGGTPAKAAAQASTGMPAPPPAEVT